MKDRHWNKLRCEKKKSPNEHYVYSVSIPNHLVKKTNWEKDNYIGFQLIESEYKDKSGENKNRYSIELINLTKEPEQFVVMTFLKQEQQFNDFIKKITPSNINNFSEDIQKFLKTEMEKRVSKKIEENNTRAEKEEKEIKKYWEKQNPIMLRKEIKKLKQDKKIRMRRIEIFFNSEIEEKKEQLNSLQKPKGTKPKK